MTRFMPPRHWFQHRLTSITTGTISGAVAAGLLTDEESSSRALKIIAGAVAGAIAGVSAPPPPDPRKW